MTDFMHRLLDMPHDVTGRHCPIRRDRLGPKSTVAAFVWLGNGIEHEVAGSAGICCCREADSVQDGTTALSTADCGRGVPPKAAAG